MIEGAESHAGPIDLNTLPEHRRSYLRRDGYVYILQVSTGIVKAGKTRNPRARIATHVRDAIKFGTTVERLWLSPMHENFSENEAYLLAALGDPEHGNEYFRVDFTTALEAAEGLTYTILSEREREDRDARLDAEAKDRVSKLFPSVPTMPEGYVSVRVPEQLGQCLHALFSTELPRGFSVTTDADVTPELISDLSKRSGLPVGEIMAWSYLQWIEHLAKSAIEGQRLSATIRAYHEDRIDLIDPAYKLDIERPPGAIDPRDALKFAAARLCACVDWVVDSIGGSMCDDSAGHDDELDALADIAAEIDRLASEFGERNTYSDGRAIKSARWIDEDALRTEHIWHPDPAQEQSDSWRGHLPSGDPDIPSPGIYEVTTYPATQEIHVRVARTA